MRIQILRPLVICAPLSIAPISSIASADPLYPTNESPVSNDSDVFGNEPYGEFFYGISTADETAEDGDSAGKLSASAEWQNWLGVTGLRGVSNLRVTAGYSRIKYKLKSQTGATTDTLGDDQKLEFSTVTTQLGAAYMVSDSVSVATRMYVPSGSQDYFVTSLTWHANGNHVGLSFEPARKSNQSPQSISAAYTRAWDRFSLFIKGSQVSTGKFEGYKDHLDLTFGSEIKVSDTGTASLAWNSPGESANSLDTFTLASTLVPYLQARYNHKVSDSTEVALYATVTPEESRSRTFDGARRTIKVSGNGAGLLLRKWL
ncbi:hypothetical protein EBZ80_03235 [bacterium]|nr:hypothetical protein [bacterium]